jgi:hypothetical protein
VRSNSENNQQKVVKGPPVDHRNSRLFADSFNLQPLRKPSAPPLGNPALGRIPNVKQNKKGRKPMAAGAASSAYPVTYYNKKTHSLTYGSPQPNHSTGNIQQQPAKPAARPDLGPRFPAPTYNGFKPIQPILEMNFKPMEDENE